MLKLYAIREDETKSTNFAFDDFLEEWLSENPDIRIVSIHPVVRKSSDKEIDDGDLPDWIHLFVLYEGEWGTAKEIEEAKATGLYRG